MLPDRNGEAAVKSLQENLARLDALSKADLRGRWVKLTGRPAPRVSAGLLRLALAWELQAREHGGLSAQTLRRLVQIARGRTRTRAAAPGMRLVRAWNGRTHVVTIDESGVVRWEDREWKSLSAVAREITGTRWSGPAFFGLKQSVQP
jgi:hypothetical protein